MSPPISWQSENPAWTNAAMLATQAQGIPRTPLDYLIVEDQILKTVNGRSCSIKTDRGNVVLSLMFSVGMDLQQILDLQRGLQGEKGDQGEMGMMGVKGDKGDPGDRGRSL